MGYKAIRVDADTHERVTVLASRLSVESRIHMSMANAIRWAIKLAEEKLQEGAKP